MLISLISLFFFNDFEMLRHLFCCPHCDIIFPGTLFKAALGIGVHAKLSFGVFFSADSSAMEAIISAYSAAVNLKPKPRHF